MNHRPEEEYLVYLYQSGGLRPITSGKNDPLTPELAVPRPTSVKSYSWLRDNLRTHGTLFHRYYDGIIIAIDDAQAPLAATIKEVATEAGFQSMESKEYSDGPLSESLAAAGFRNHTWREILLLRK